MHILLLSVSVIQTTIKKNPSRKKKKIKKKNKIKITPRDYSRYVQHNYGSQTKFVRHIVFAPFLIIILLLSFLLPSAKSLSDTFLGDALIKLYETL